VAGFVVVVGHLEREDAAGGKGGEEADERGDARGGTEPVEDGVAEEEIYFRPSMAITITISLRERKSGQIPPHKIDIGMGRE
jgi:hypothetical protein